MNNIKWGYISIPLTILAVVSFLFYKNFENSKIEYEPVDIDNIVDDTEQFYTDRDHGELETYKEEHVKSSRLTTIEEIPIKFLPSENTNISKALYNFSVKGPINVKVITGSDEYWIKYKSFKNPSQVKYNEINIIMGDKVYTPDGYLDTDEYYFYCSDLLNIMTSLKRIDTVKESEETIIKGDESIDCYVYSYSTRKSAKIHDLSRKFYINKETMNIEMVKCDLGQVEFYDFDDAFSVNDIEYNDEIITNFDFPFINLSQYVGEIDEEDQDE